MSAFVMDERFFNQLASELYAHATLKHSSLQWAVEYVLELRSVPENRYEEWIRQFAQTCYVLNVCAVNHRYGQDDPAPAIRFTPASGLPQWSDVQLIRYLECLSYQCAEGDTESDPNYQKLEKLIGHVARTLISKTDEYEAARYDYAA